MATLFRWARELEYFEPSCFIMGRTLINSLPRPPTSSLSEFIPILHPSAQTSSSDQLWLRSGQVPCKPGIEGLPPTGLRTQFNVMPHTQGSLESLLLNSRALHRLKRHGSWWECNLRTKWTLCLWSFTFQNRKIMLTVDSALCGFQTFIYSGYTLRPFFKLLLFWKGDIAWNYSMEKVTGDILIT